MKILRNISLDLHIGVKLAVLLIAVGMFGANPIYAQSATQLSSIAELREAMRNSNGNYRMTPGTYTAIDMQNMDSAAGSLNAAYLLTGNDNTFDMTGANFEAPISALNTSDRDPNHLLVWGDGNTIIGGSWSTLLNNPALNVRNDQVLSIDFVAYNEDGSNRPGKGGLVDVRILGHDTRMINNTLTARGSYPYGYGEIYGKGRDNVFGLRKHSLLMVNGNNTLIDGLDASVQTFGHGIFMQGASNTTIRNSRVEGVVRTGRDMINDGLDSIPAKYDFMQFYPDWREGPIDPNTPYALAEDGIRSYSTGSTKDGATSDTGAVYVYDTTVINMRSGIALSASSECIIERSTMLGNEKGFAVCGKGDVIDSAADAAHGPVVQTERYARNNTFEIEILDTPNSTGDHGLTEISGGNHTFNFTSNVENPINMRPIVLGYSWDRWAPDDDQNHTDDITLNNNTTYPVNLLPVTDGTTGFSGGAVNDSGTSNNVEFRAPTVAPGNPIETTGPSMPAAANEACFYSHPQYTGTSSSDHNFRVCTGVIVSEFIQDHDNRVSAISVGSGVHAIIHENNDYTGDTLCISSSTDLNELGSLNDSASSFQVGAGSCPTAPTTNPPSTDKTVQIRKRNAQSFALDGGNEAANGQNVFMWTQRADNVNQQWIEIDRGNGYFTYQKQGTNHCLDGGNGGASRQNVYLWACSSGNQNQHWLKVNMDSGYFQLRKRNAPDFTLDGGSGGSDGKNVGLYDASNSSHNLQWSIN